jgi:hypothetical protein
MGFRVHCGGNIGGNALNGVAAGLTGFDVHCGNNFGGNGVADDDDGVGLKKPLAGGTSSDETAEAPEPLAVVATAGLPLALLDLLMFLD